MKLHPESTWTQPRPDCPTPQWWHATDSQSTEVEVTELVGAFVRALQPEYVVETGTCVGHTARAIGEALARNGHGRLVSLEVEADRIAYARLACAGLPVQILQCESLEFTPEQTVDFAWLDSRTDLRIPEFARYRPHMRPGTVVGFHDTGPHMGAFADHTLTLPGTRAIRLPTPRGVTFVEIL